MIFFFFLASAILGILMILELKSLYLKHGRLRGASIVTSLWEFIWLFVSAYIVFFVVLEPWYKAVPALFVAYNVIGWILSATYIEEKDFHDYKDIDEIEDLDLAAQRLEEHMKEDIERLKNTQIPRDILIKMIYFSVLYALANLYIVAKLSGF